jgi:hypothetical protein
MMVPEETEFERPLIQFSKVQEEKFKKQKLLIRSLLLTLDLKSFIKIV